MLLVVRVLLSSVMWVFSPFARGLRLDDLFVLVLAQLKVLLTGPYAFGHSRAAALECVRRIERPFLDCAFLIAQLFLPMGWYGWFSTVSEDVSVPSREPERRIPVRVIEPKAVDNGGPGLDAERPLLILWMHGGGLFMGSARGEGVLYRYYAARMRATVVSVEYRLVPEHRFPAALDDCEDVARALLSDPKYRGHRFVVAGMSAGGYLSIQLSLALAHAGVHVDAHVAIAPMVAPLAHFMSMPSNHFYQLFAPRDISWSWAHYLADVPPHEWDWRVSALLAPDETLARTSPGIVCPNADPDPNANPDPNPREDVTRIVSFHDTAADHLPRSGYTHSLLTTRH